MSVRRRTSKILNTIVAIAALFTANLAGPALGQPGRGRDEVLVITIPQFVATAVSIKALDETGWDWTGDDEVQAAFADFNPVQERTAPEFWNVDAGETKKFAAADRCMAPQPSCDHGAHALHFAVALWERDEAPWPFANWCNGHVAGNHDWYESGFCSGDDLIGRKEISLSQADLVAALPTVGDTADYTVKPTGGAGSYQFTYRITRLANVQRNLIIHLPPPETLPSINLQATVAAIRGGGSSVTLSWSGATTTTVDLYRNGPVIATTANDGKYVEVLPAGTYQYLVCETGSTAACSAPASVTVP